MTRPMPTFPCPGCGPLAYYDMAISALSKRMSRLSGRVSEDETALAEHVSDRGDPHSTMARVRASVAEVSPLNPDAASTYDVARGVNAVADGLRNAR